MPRSPVRCVAFLFVLASGVPGAAQTEAQRTLLLHPSAPELNRTAPEVWRVRLDTTQGAVLMELHRDWSPHGVDRFYNLVSAGYYDDARFFRVIANRWSQFGINGDPGIAKAWRAQREDEEPSSNAPWSLEPGTTS